MMQMLSVIKLMDVITAHVAMDRGEGGGGGDNIFKSTYQNVAKFGRDPVHITLKLMKASKYLLNRGVL